MVLAKLFLAEMLHVTEVLKGYTESVPEGFGPIFTACVKMMRGFLGLACPTPGHASLEDVQHIFPSNASTAKLALDLPGGSGRAVISMLRKDKGNFWHDANSEFCLTIGFAEQISAEYKKLEKDLAEIIQVLGLLVDGRSPASPHRKLTELVGSTCVKIFDRFGSAFPKWNSGGLRPCGLDELSAQVNVFATGVFNLMHEFFTQPPQPSWYAAMVTVLKVVLPLLKNEVLLQSVADVALTLSCRESSHKIEDVLDKMEHGVDEEALRALVHALMGKAKEKIPKELSDRIKGIFWKIAGWCVGGEHCWRRGVASDGTKCEDGFTLCSLYASRVASVNDEVLWGNVVTAASKLVKAYDTLDPVSQTGTTLFANVHKASADAKEFREAVLKCKFEDPALSQISRTLSGKLMLFIN